MQTLTILLLAGMIGLLGALVATYAWRAQQQKQATQREREARLETERMVQHAESVRTDLMGMTDEELRSRASGPW